MLRTVHRSMTPSLSFLRGRLWLVTQRPLINAFVSYLHTQRQALEANPHQIDLSSASDIEEVRADFASMIQEGEARLHRLGGLVANALSATGLTLRVLSSEKFRAKLRFEYAQSISTKALAETDSPLATQTTTDGDRR